MIDLEKILELEARATGAPWDEMHFDTYCCAVGPECVEQKQARKDQDLINLMRNNIRQICLELQAAREYFSKDSEVRQISLKEGLQAASNAWQDREDLLQKYHEVANGKG